MIKSVTVTNYLGDRIKLELARPELSGFAVVSIDGLGPGKSTINATEVSTGDGGIFNSARLSARNIVISTMFMRDRSPEDMRHLSYKYFPIKKKVTLLIETDTRLAEIEGYVESNEPTIFSSFEGSSISIICPDPHFYAAGRGSTNITMFRGIIDTFKFPFWNDSFTEPLLEMSQIKRDYQKVIVYEGDGEVGITIRIYAIGEAENIEIHNLDTRESMCIDTAKIASYTGDGIRDNDEIVICTTKGKKSINLIRDNKTINILNCLDKNANWFKLVKGDNTFAYTAKTGIDNLQFRIENRIMYEGV